MPITPLIADDYKIKVGDTKRFVDRFNAWVSAIVNLIPQLNINLADAESARNIALAARDAAQTAQAGAEEPLINYVKKNGAVITDVAETHYTFTTTDDTTIIDLSNGNSQAITFNQDTSMSIVGATDGEMSVLVLRLKDAPDYFIELTDMGLDFGELPVPDLTSDCEIVAHSVDGISWPASFRDFS